MKLDIRIRLYDLWFSFAKYCAYKIFFHKSKYKWSGSSLLIVKAPTCYSVCIDACQYTADIFPLFFQQGVAYQVFLWTALLLFSQSCWDQEIVPVPVMRNKDTLLLKMKHLNHYIIYILKTLNYNINTILSTSDVINLIL